MVARRLGALVVSTICMGLLLGSASIALAQQQSKNQQRCMVGINRDTQKVASREAWSTDYAAPIITGCAIE